MKRIFFVLITLVFSKFAESSAGSGGHFNCIAGKIRANLSSTRNGFENAPCASSLPINTQSESFSGTKTRITVSSQPAYTFPEATRTEFSGDFSNTALPLLYNVSGTGTMGQPKTGYQWSPAVTPYQSLTNYGSGWNQSSSNNSGRTGYSVHRDMIVHSGQGDAMTNYSWCSLSGNQRAGATHWLANPACAVHAADLASQVDHGYLQGIGDLNFSDNGHDIAVVADVRNFNRTNNSAAFGDVWLAYRTQSTGSKGIDVGISLSGKHVIGIDTVMATGNNRSSTIALNMAQDQRIYFNSTPSLMNGIPWYGDKIGDAYADYDSASDELKFCKGAACLRMNNVYGGGYIDGFASVSGSIIAGGLVKPGTYTVATLPACVVGLLGYLGIVSNGADYRTRGYGVSVGPAAGNVTRQVICTNSASGKDVIYEWVYN